MYIAKLLLSLDAKVQTLAVLNIIIDSRLERTAGETT
jgi:hypothetical protein